MKQLLGNLVFELSYQFDNKNKVIYSFLKKINT